MTTPTIGVALSYDDRELLLKMRNGEKRLAYGVSEALRATMLQMQSAIQEHTLRAFTTRKVEFIRRFSCVIEKWPSPRDARPWGEMAVGMPSKAGTLLLAYYEQGAPRRPFTPGAKSVAVPILGRPARPSFAQGVPPVFTFQGMALKAFYENKRLRKRRRAGRTDVGLFGEYGRLALPDNADRSRIQWKGNNRTFLLPSSRRAQLGAVFQRIGPKRGDVREVWTFKQGLHLDDRLQFVATGRAIADRWFAENVQRAAVESIAHDAGRSGA